MGFYEMHTEEMQKYRYLDSANTLDLFYELDETSKKIAETKAIAEESFLYSQIKEIVENCYDIGKIEEIYEIFGGYVNRSFGLYTVKDGERQTSANICAIKT